MRYMNTLLLLVSMLLISCTGTNENPFLGKWERTKHPIIIEIIQNGDDMLLVEKNGKSIAKIGEDGNLQVSGPLGVISFTYIAETDTIAGAGEEYRRVK